MREKRSDTYKTLWEIKKLEKVLGGRK